ncbi:tripartite tricarboxylate transporter TctB family protein [Achromobacter sp. GG226]|uniref:tripartite tricarboxylate transporter TctB family protein n=1 Tax=Verticiella alkaliphila TaxID=2779529 RepID=UPI001C0B446E|nr:tripartite tricarboxylate transporter TctB family protein [Verticiella sp. GG226]MBU4611065.1 tripartite tricarboxylate transporter TctB family protein [Verticiella sp. GG226]
MRIQSQQNFWSGVMFVVTGLLFAWFATDYQMGTAARMGPGYFPFWLGTIMAVLGAIIGISALSPKAERTEIDKFDWRCLLLVLGSVVAFGLLLKPLGLYLSLAVLVIGSSLASHEFSWKVAIGNAIFLVVFAYVAFVKGLGLIFPLYPWFMG